MATNKAVWQAAVNVLAVASSVYCSRKQLLRGTPTTTSVFGHASMEHRLRCRDDLARRLREGRFRPCRFRGVSIRRRVLPWSVIGLNSGAALATVVDVLAQQVPVILSLAPFVKRTRGRAA